MQYIIDEKDLRKINLLLWKDKNVKFNKIEDFIDYLQEKWLLTIKL